MADVKIKGRKMGSIANARKSMKKGGGSFIKGVPEEGITVRFLTEPDGWFGYPEHYDETARAFYPCIDGQCPGCEQGLRPSNKYLVNAVDIEEDKVIPLKLAKTLANRIMIKHDKAKPSPTIMDRDFELTRSGEGFDTEYDVESLERRRRPLSKYKLLDLQQVLLDAWTSAFGEGDDEDVDDEDEQPRTRKAARPVAKANPRAKRAIAAKAGGTRKAVGTTKKGVVRKAAATKKVGAKRPVTGRRTIRS